jgi:hypothetical protein
VDNSIYLADTEPKYFIYPDTMTVSANGSIAPAFPTALVTPAAINFGTALNSQALSIQNIGGSYPYGVTPSSVELEWAVGANPSFVSVTPTSGSRNTTIGSDTLLVTADRTGAAGLYSGTLVITYTGNTLGIANAVSIPITLQIAAPVLTVDTNTLNFGAVTTSLTVNASNTGQSTLNWLVNTAGFPAWLTVAPTIGTATNGVVSPIGVTVNRATLTPGNPYTYTFAISSNGGVQNITVNVTG